MPPTDKAIARSRERYKKWPASIQVTMSPDEIQVVVEFPMMREWEQAYKTEPAFRDALEVAVRALRSVVAVNSVDLESDNITRENLAREALAEIDKIMEGVE